MRYERNKKADIIVDLQFGSTGKGLISGALATWHGYDVVVTANMPNAGHTFIDWDDHKMVHKVLPNGVVSPKCDWALIGPGAVFDLQRLKDEIDHLHKIGYDGFAVGIHPNAVVLHERHKINEGILSAIGSTMQGSSEAMIHKMKRDVRSSPIARDQLRKHNFEGYPVHILTHLEYDNIIETADKILLEGAQGFSLGINQQFYPYCTSRECTPARFMSDMGIPLPLLNKVIGTCRVHPIRVGNTPDGYSGDFYHDQRELSWEEIGVEPERTTVTNRVRRVFSWSTTQIFDALWHCAPDEVFLNFCNYAKPDELVMARNQLGDLLTYEGWGPSIDYVKRVR